eukprot:5138618-Karenia_brevis.AAC.1
MRQIRKSYVAEKIVWFDKAKSREALRPGRVLTRAFNAIKDFSANEELAAQVELDQPSRRIKIKGSGTASSSLVDDATNGIIAEFANDDR